jgi:hypothetical protein
MADESLIKQSIIDLARKQAADGAHYLWGAAGNTPGQSDGAHYRPSHVQLHPNVPDLTDQAGNGTKRAIPLVPTLFAGWVDSSDQGKLACSGRAAVKDVQDLNLALKIAVKDALGLQLKSLTPAQLDEFKNNAKDAAKFRWPRPNGGLDRSAYPSTVWGESCVGVRHFDCIGLVNYCFSTILNEDWQFGIDSFAVPDNARSAGFVEVKPLSTAKSCDIVTIGREHIGIVTNLQTAIEAMDPGDGVVERPITAAGWTQCWRVPASTWT